MGDETDIYQIPYLTDEDLVEDTPSINKAQAERIDYLFSVNTGEEGPEGPPGPPRDSLYGDLQPADPDFPGCDCESVPPGGDAGDVLTKDSADDYAASWAPPADGLPPGGDAGDVLTKDSSDDGAASWAVPADGLPPGGDAGDVLTKDSADDGAASWAAPTGGFLMPPGVIAPFMGDTAPDGWLLCDGSEYDPADLPELHAVNAAFHNDGTFRVPDLRGRSPIGTGMSHADYSRDLALGERFGDYVVGQHTHRVTVAGSPSAEMCGWPGGGGPATTFIKSQSEINNHNVGAHDHRLIAGTLPSWTASAPMDRAGLGDNYHPTTGVNFIVYAGRSTAGISPLSELAPVTTRMMIEARLAEEGISEEEVKALREQLAAYERNQEEVA